MADLPEGTVTFLFTDIEGSTRLLDLLGERYAAVLSDYRTLLRAAFQEWGGQEVDTRGEESFFAFSRARDAVFAAVAAQKAVAAHPWPEGIVVRLRIGIHTGEAVSHQAGYVGIDVHRAARICAAGHGGQILLSLATAELVADDLQETVRLNDLGKHRLKDLARPQHLFQAIVPALPADFPPLKSLETLPNNLPVQLTTFVGREREKADLKKILTTRTRLLTLTGSGGAGKTRLALQVAAEVLESFADGVWFVELGSLSDPALVPQTVASALTVREQVGRPITATLIDHLRHKHLLLVLDNCEHLLAATAELARRLLRSCVNLRILSTSREALGVEGEIAWRVPSLSVPDPRRALPAETLADYEAVRLFVERAIAAMPKFSLTSQNGLVVAGICRHLDGIPLAIELAAARLKVLSVEQIAQRLDDRFRLLTTGTRTGLPRHQTLRATMDWSYELLPEEERSLLRRLSVFAGAFTLDVAMAVCADPPQEEYETLDLLARLVDKSLVLVEGDNGSLRYRLLETVRQYAQEKLRDAAEMEVMRDRHRDWYLSLAEQAEPEVQGPHQVEWLNRLESEHDNLRAALEWSLERDDEAGLRLAAALWWFWYARGHLSEGREWLERALVQCTDASPSWRARALYRTGFLAWSQQDADRARMLCEESLALCRQLGETWGVAFSLHVLGRLPLLRGEYREAITLLEESLALFRTLGDRREVGRSLIILAQAVSDQGQHDRATELLNEALTLFRDAGHSLAVAYSLSNLGRVAQRRGDVELASEFLHDSLARLRDLGNKFGIAFTLDSLGAVARSQGDYAEALERHDESLAHFRELGDKGDIARAMRSLGVTLLRQGSTDGAAAHLMQSLRLRMELGDPRGMAECLEGLAGVARVRGQMHHAAHLFGAADALRERIGCPLPPAERTEYDADVAAAREALTEEAFVVQWTEGRAATPEQTVERLLRGDYSASGARTA